MKDRVVILRHDIDYSLDKAVALAELERELGVSSTYFVLLTSEFYNLLSKDNLSKISKIGTIRISIRTAFRRGQLLRRILQRPWRYRKCYFRGSQFIETDNRHRC